MIHYKTVQTVFRLVLLTAVVIGGFGKQNRPKSVCPAIGVANSSVVPDKSFSASSIMDCRHSAHNARLYGDKIGWSPSWADINTGYLQIDLGAVYTICAIATQGSSVKNKWVARYFLLFSYSGNSWTYYHEDGKPKEFAGNDNSKTVARRVLNATAKMVRLRPTKFEYWPTMRVEIYGSKVYFSTPKPTIVTEMTPGTLPPANRVVSTIFTARSAEFSIPKPTTVTEVTLGKFGPPNVPSSTVITAKSVGYTRPCFEDEAVLATVLALAFLTLLLIVTNGFAIYRLHVLKSAVTVAVTYEAPTAGHTPDSPTGAARAQITQDAQPDLTQEPVGGYMPVQVLHTERQDYESLDNALAPEAGQEESVEEENSTSGEYENVPEINPRSEYPFAPRDYVNVD